MRGRSSTAQGEDGSALGVLRHSEAIAPLHDGDRACMAATDAVSSSGYLQMIGRLNHVAIAVPRPRGGDGAVSRTRWVREVSAPLPQPEHGVTVVFVNLPNTKIELLEPLGEGSPIASFLQRSPAGGIHHICYEVADILEGARPAQGGRRARAGRRRAEDRRARQAGAVPASQGFQRHAGRTRAGLRRHERHLRDRDLLHHLVDGAVCRPADRRAHAGRGRRHRSGHARERADRAAAAARRCCSRR